MPALKCHGDKPAVIRGNQFALGGDTICKGGKIGEIGQEGLKLALSDEGIGVAVDGQGAQLLALEGDDQRLAGIDEGAAAQHRIVSEQLPERNVVPGGNGGESFAGADGVGQPGKLDHQRLPYGQTIGGGEAVVDGQERERDAVGLGDGEESVAGATTWITMTRPSVQESRVMKSLLA